jgi:hypothetical protein
MKKLVCMVIALVLFQSCGPKEGSHVKGPLKVKGRLGIGPVAHSIWDDGTLSMAIPIENSGNRPAGDVKVSSISLGDAKLVAPAALPVPMGEIISNRRSVLQTRFSSLVSGSYTLTVTGVYADNRASQPFTLTAGVVVTRPGKGTGSITAKTITVQGRRPAANRRSPRRWRVSAKTTIVPGRPCLRAPCASPLPSHPPEPDR